MAHGDDTTCLSLEAFVLEAGRSSGDMVNGDSGKGLNESSDPSFAIVLTKRQQNWFRDVMQCCKAYSVRPTLITRSWVPLPCNYYRV